MTLRNTPISTPASTAHSGRGPFAVLRRAKSIKSAGEAEREALLEDADRLETWAAYLVLGAIVLEAIVWASPLCPFLFKLGNFIADAAVAIGVYGEMRFGHVVGDILRVRLAEANVLAEVASGRAASASSRADQAMRELAAANVRVAELGKQTELLRADNLALEAKIAPRRLTRAQQAELTALFAKCPGSTVRVASYMLDIEGTLLGHQILTVAQSSGLPTDNKLMSEGPLGGMMFGISVTGTDAALAADLMLLLGAFGLSPTADAPPVSAGISMGGQNAPFSAKIFVGAKPFA